MAGQQRSCVSEHGRDDHGEDSEGDQREQGAEESAAIPPTIALASMNFDGGAGTIWRISGWRASSVRVSMTVRSAWTQPLQCAHSTGA